MTRISTGQTYDSALLGVLQAQARQNEAGRQYSSGFIAHDLKGYADTGSTLTAAQTVKARAEALTANNDVLTDRLKAQDLALSAVEDAAGGARKAVADAVATGDGAQLIQKLNGWLGQATQALNADYAGQKLFAGGTTGQDPVDAKQLSDLITPNTVAQRFHDGTFVRKDRIDEDTVLDTSVTASQAGRPLYDQLAALAAYDQPPTGPFTNKLTQTQIDWLTSQLPALDAATATARSYVAKNGANQARLDTTSEIVKNRQSAAENLVADKLDVDTAEAASRLQLAGVALQAAAQGAATLSSSALLDVRRR